MRALVLSDDGARLQTDRPDPAPAAGEVLVRVLRAGICETDLQLIRGYKGFRGVLGHEFVGVALERGRSKGSGWSARSTAAAGRARPAPPAGRGTARTGR